MIDENVGRVLAQKYELVRALGRGGMGAVYEGRTQIGKRVAIKLLIEPELIRNLDLIARFFREAHAAAAVESRHVVDVYDTGVDEATGFPFIIMALLSGEDLERVMRRVGALHPIAAVRIASQAAAGLAKAHEAGIIHRDVKPANLFLAKDDGEFVVKILDFGVAKLGGDGALTAVDQGTPLTRSGAVLGTPLYMSPEQAQGLKTIDARTDVWSLGMCLYQSLAGRLPFDDIDTLGKVIVAIVTHEVPPLATWAPWVRPELAAVVHQALERDPGKRVSSARHLIQLLAPFLGGSSSITAEILMGAREQEASRVSILPEASTSSDLPSAPTSFHDTVPLQAAVTTSGVSSARIPVPGAKRPAAARTLPLAVAGLVAVLAGAFVLTRGGSKAGGDNAATEASNPLPPASSPVALVAPAASASSAGVAASEPKEGLLTLKMPEGYSVKIDGVAPGSPESHGASRLMADGRLALQGDFQTKFLVAIFDKTGKRVLVQDVYLYDNKLDPDVIDTTVGAVVVEKPRPQKPAAGALPARF
jgi:serine/threonine-protein kinase